MMFISGRPALLMTGMTCVAMAGLALLVTNVQLGVMFGRGQTTFVGVLSGILRKRLISVACILL